MGSSSFNIIVNDWVRDLIESHAKSSPQEIYGWLVGFEKGNSIYILTAITCERYEMQHYTGAAPSPLEIQEIGSALPNGLGIIGFYHSHPADIFHSSTDDKTLMNLSRSYPKMISAVTNGKNTKWYQLVQNSQQTKEISVKFQNKIDSQIQYLIIHGILSFSVSIDPLYPIIPQLSTKLINEFNKMFKESKILIISTKNLMRTIIERKIISDFDLKKMIFENIRQDEKSVLAQTMVQNANESLLKMIFGDNISINYNLDISENINGNSLKISGYIPLSIKIDPAQQGSPILEIDCRKIGPLNEQDYVELMPYNVPDAEKIQITIKEEESVGIPEGDWTSTAKPFLLGKTVDYGDNVNLAIDFSIEGKRNVKLIKGIVSNANPPLPTLISDFSRIELKKIPQKKNWDLIKELDAFKINRAKSCMTDREKSQKEFISQVKLGKYEKVTETLNFKNIEAENLVTLIEGIFFGFELFEEKLSSSKGNFSCSRLFIIRQCEKIIALVEYQIFSTQEGGSMILTTYSESYDKALEILNNLQYQMEKIHYELKKLPKGIMKCPECSAPLPIDQADCDGTVICEQCGAEINISKK